MEKEKIKDRIKKHFENLEEWAGGKGYRTFHSINVAEIALRIAQEERLDIDPDILYLACVSHDLRKDEVFKYGLIIYTLERYIDIDSMVLEYLQEFYKDFSFQNKFLEKVARVLNEKNLMKPQFIESKLLFDADELVNLGNLSVWRQFIEQAYMKHTMDLAVDNWFGNIKLKQIKLVDTLKFEFSKRLAKKRIERCNNFFKILKKEMQNQD